MTAQPVALLLPVPLLPLAACRGHDVALWFTHGREADAKAVCAGCPERVPCLAYAKATGQRGVWGATTELERADPERDHPVAPLVAAHPDWSGRQIARLAGCDVGVVYRLRRKLRAVAAAS